MMSSPRDPFRVSLPSPPQMTSFPVTPSTSSSPPRGWMTSSAGVPVMSSSSGVPTIVASRPMHLAPLLANAGVALGNHTMRASVVTTTKERGRTTLMTTSSLQAGLPLGTSWAVRDRLGRADIEVAASVGRIRAEIPVQDIVAAPAGERVVALAAADLVVAALAVERVVAALAEDRVVPAVAVHVIGLVG